MAISSHLWCENTRQKNRTIRIKNQQAFSFYSLINSQKLSLKIRSHSSMVRNKETSALHTLTSSPWTQGACHLRRFPLSSSTRFNGRKKTLLHAKKREGAANTKGINIGFFFSGWKSSFFGVFFVFYSVSWGTRFVFLFICFPSFSLLLITYFLPERDLYVWQKKRGRNTFPGRIVKR